jgi:hypothetical protein
MWIIRACAIHSGVGSFFRGNRSLGHSLCAVLRESFVASILCRVRAGHILSLVPLVGVIRWIIFCFVGVIC